MQDLQPRLRKLLGTSSKANASSSSAADTSSSSPRVDCDQSAEPLAWQEVGNAVTGPGSSRSSEVSRGEGADVHADERNSLDTLEALGVGHIGDERSQPEHSGVDEGPETDAAGDFPGGAEPEGFATAGFVALAPIAAGSMAGHQRYSGISGRLRPGWHVDRRSPRKISKLGPPSLPRRETCLARFGPGSSSVRQAALFRF